MMLCAAGMRAEDRPPLPELRLEMQPQPSDVTEFTEAEDATEDALASGLTVTFQVLFSSMTMWHGLSMAGCERGVLKSLGRTTLRLLPCQSGLSMKLL